MARFHLDPLPIVGLYGAPASMIAERYISKWRADAIEMPFAPGMTVDQWGADIADLDELMRPSLIVTTGITEPGQVKAVADNPFGLFLQTERRPGPNGFMAGARQVFWQLTLPDYTMEHALTATYLVIEAHIRWCRRKVGRE